MDAGGRELLRWREPDQKKAAKINGVEENRSIAANGDLDRQSGDEKQSAEWRARLPATGRHKPETVVAIRSDAGGCNRSVIVNEADRSMIRSGSGVTERERRWMKPDETVVGRRGEELTLDRRTGPGGTWRAAVRRELISDNRGGGGVWRWRGWRLTRRLTGGERQARWRRR